jgi:hypothetical protein
VNSSAPDGRGRFGQYLHDQEFRTAVARRHPIPIATLTFSAIALVPTAMAFALTWPVSRTAVVGFAIVDIPLVVVCVVIVTRKLKRMESP